MKKAREISGDGIIGYNIMVALKEYASHVKAAVKLAQIAGIDIEKYARDIVCGRKTI